MKKYEITKGLCLDRSLRALVAVALPDLRIAASLRFRRTSLVGLVFTAALALLPISAGAQCANWDMSGRVLIFQKNLRHPVELTLEQKGRVIVGRSYQQIDTGNFGLKEDRGLVDGTIDGDRVSFQIFWPDNIIGVYDARVLPSGRLDGEGYKKGASNVKITFFSGGTLKCLPPPPVIPKPIKSSGKARVKPAPAQTSQPAPPPMKVPGIITSQVIYPYPNVPTGFIILTWDAGRDHPYAEVWFKIGSPQAPATFLVEQAKGSRQIPVERYKYYSYTLTDAGKTLAEVTFVAP